MPRVTRRWIRRDVDEAAAQHIAEITGIHVRTARLLVQRGVRESDEAERYLRPQLAHMHDPFCMKHVDRAAQRIADAIANGEKIALYGDYDVDGVTSTSLLASFLADHGVAARTYIPKRLIEGYGLNHEAVDILSSEGTRLLITLDCGITAADEIAYANELGLDTIVVDHHRCPPELPPAYATLNPHQADCEYPDKVFAAVGVCFNLVVALRKVLRDRGAYKGKTEPNLRRLLDLVALGSICDMVPLTGVNRLLTWFGMLELRHALRPGVRALMEVSQVVPNKVGSSDVGFRLGPRINAAGRLEDASVGVRLLLSQDMTEARRLAEALDAVNKNRRLVEGEVFRQAVTRVEEMGDLGPALVLADPGWHPGVVGIVASKLVERFDRPTILIGEGGRGSARTAKNLHLYDALNDCSSHLTKFGGHRAAAGMRISHAKVDAFKQDFLQRVIADPDYGGQSQSILHFDDDLVPEDIDMPWYDELSRLEPFGMGNPEPLFRIKKMSVRSRRIVGVDHLKLRFNEGQNGGLQAIAFKMADRDEELEQSPHVDVAFHLEKNEWKGLTRLELRVRDLDTGLEPQEAPAKTDVAAESDGATESAVTDVDKPVQAAGSTETSPPS